MNRAATTSDELGLPRLATAGRQRPSRRDLVWRERAVTRCLEGDPKLLYVCAPSGYGKTTTLAQWAEEDPRASEWISLDWRHNDPALLVGSLAAAINQFEPLDDHVVAPLTTASPNLGVATSRICEAIGACDTPYVLVIDDLHKLDNPDALQPLLTIAEATPPGSTVAIATLPTPGLNLGRLRAHGGMTELGPADLQMTPVEAAALLRASGLDLTTRQVEELTGHTEGWPAGLYLAALALSGQDDPEASLRSFYGDDRVVSDYLREEFLDALADDDRDFLVRTSVLDRISAPLCDAVLDRTDSGAVLRRVSRSNLLFSPIDARERTYRCHALLREMLESELHTLDPGEKTSLHLRASRFYADGEDHDRAVAHAIASGDVEFAAGLIWELTPEFETSGRGDTLRRWLTSFSERQREGSAALCLTAAAIDSGNGDGLSVERWIAAARRALAASAHPQAAQLEAAASLIAATGAARDGVTRMGDDVAEVAAMLPEESDWWILAQLILGVARHLSGDLAEARRVLTRTARAGSLRTPNLSCLCRSQLALLALDEGDRVGARDAVRDAVAAVERFGLDAHPTQALTLATAALVRAHDGEADVAAGWLRQADLLLERFNDFSGWYEAEARIVIARALLLLDDVAGARARLAEAGRRLRDVEDAEVLRGWIERAWEDADAAQSVTGRWPLTPAELRLLHHLPSHRTYPQIADELFISTNTVKTHAQSIYRKLGASSRSEAVLCAQAAGLLNEGSDT